MENCCIYSPVSCIISPMSSLSPLSLAPLPLRIFPSLFVIEEHQLQPKTRLPSVLRRIQFALSKIYFYIHIYLYICIYKLLHLFLTCVMELDWRRKHFESDEQIHSYFSLHVRYNVYAKKKLQDTYELCSSVSPVRFAE